MKNLAIKSSPQYDHAELLDSYHKGSTLFFSTPTTTLLAEGNLSQAFVSHKQGIITASKALLKEHLRTHPTTENDIVAGVIPLDTRQASYWVVPAKVFSAATISPMRHLATAPVFEHKPTIQTQKQKPSPENYKDIVHKALQCFKETRLQKAVLSRSVELESATPIDRPQLLKNLTILNPNAYHFALNIPGQISVIENQHNIAKLDIKTQRTLMGASPELLLSKRGLKISSNPLAGSRPKSTNEQINKQHVEDLLKSKKDQWEHALVIDEIAKILKPLCSELHVPKEPEITETESMIHLSTHIHGVLRHQDISVQEVVLALHPTPAVCGHPTDLALKQIQSTEGFDRSFFTGVVGWCNAEGDGDWVIAIRCAEIENLRLRLYAGAGIVEGSQPDLELAETSAKLQTMIKALQHSDLQI